ncbi:hypothetical protein [Nocardioides speluncae]|uniref:hypothetical protein n=1 Tax=Nocardioides speluncae TaxID=2670337 RepID=UPI000D692E8B|nr:hypothetical protein [Nocardioides speluncae]
MKKPLTKVAIALAVAALPLTTLSPPTAQAAGTSGEPWMGYSIPQNRTAASGWLGGRKVFPNVVYRIDPTKANHTLGFRKAYLTDKLTGSGTMKVSERANNKAAWIATTWGAFRNKDRSAAVDIALYHLLHGGAYSLNGSKTTARLRPTRKAATIRDLARDMLADANRYAGPYKITVSANNSIVGKTVTVKASVVTTTGRAIAGLPVVVSYPGAASVTRYTGSTGGMSAQFTPDSGGDKKVRVQIKKLPDYRLKVRMPQNLKASRVVVARHYLDPVITKRIVVRARPKVATRAASTRIKLGQQFAGTFQVKDGVETPRSAVATLYGPFTHAANATCAAAREVDSTGIPVKLNSTYQLPKLASKKAGFYVWGVYLRENRLNLAARTCGARTQVLAVPKVGIRAETTPVRPGTRVRAKLTVSGLPAGYNKEARIRLVGPFRTVPAGNCTRSSKIHARFIVPVTKSGSYWTTRAKIGGPGVYFWQAILPSNAVSATIKTKCKAPGTIVRVN